MPWYEVIIQNNDVADQNAAGLMNSCGRVLLEADTPPGAVEAYQGRNEQRDRIFYFFGAPPFPDSLAQQLEQFDARPCAEPDLRHFTRVEFP